MTLKPRDTRALCLLGLTAAGFLVFSAWGRSGGQADRVGSIRIAECRLQRLRQSARSVLGREDLFKRVSAELAEREKGVLPAETVAQAQAQLWEILGRVNKDQGSRLEFGNVELGCRIDRLGEDYGEVEITVPFTCRMDDLVNFIAEFPRQPELIATREIDIAAADPKQKTVSVRLTVSAVVQGRLAQAKTASY